MPVFPTFLVISRRKPCPRSLPLSASMLHAHQLQQLLLLGPRTIPAAPGETRLIPVPVLVQVDGKLLPISEARVALVDGQKTYILSVEEHDGSS